MQPLTGTSLDAILAPFKKLVEDGGAVLGMQLHQIQAVLQELQVESRAMKLHQTQSAQYSTVEDGGGPYTVRYQGRRYMDVLAWNTADITANITANVLIPGLGQTTTTPLTIIGMQAMMTAGLSPWVALNLPEQTSVQLVANATAGQHNLLYVRYGMETWGAR